MRGVVRIITVCLRPDEMSRPVFAVEVAQLVRASDCGSEGRGFESHLPPLIFSLIMKIIRFFLSSHTPYGVNYGVILRPL